jgi:hypothetical protein
MTGAPTCVAANLDTPHLIQAADLDTLVCEARIQERNFINGCPSSDAAGVELFRRAIEQQDQLAWEAILALYRGLLLAYCSRVVIRRLVPEDDQFYVERAFERFWRATRRAEIGQFRDLGAILSYLQMTLSSVLLDDARARRRQATLSLGNVSAEASLSDDPAGLATSRGAGRELWRTIEAELHDDDERLIARLSFLHGMAARHIRTRYPERFVRIGDIYRIKRNIVERLRHSPAIRELLRD